MQENDKAGNIAKLEAYLFHYGEPIQVSALCKALDFEPDKLNEAVIALEEKYANETSSALMILRHGERIQLVTKPDFAGLHKTLMTDEFKEVLTPVALETLSLIAYLGPIQRSLLDFIRGVNTSFTVRSLQMRGLIERVHDTKQLSPKYAVSMLFLRHLGLQRLQELPDYEKYRDVLHRYTAAAKDEAVA